MVTHLYLLVVCAFRAGEVPGAAGRVGGDDGSLVVIVNVAALLTLLAVGDHRTPLVYHFPARNLYCQRATSVRDKPACRFDSTASRAGTGVSCSPQAWLLLELTKPVLISVTFGNREAALDLAVLVSESGGMISLILTSPTSRERQVARRGVLRLLEQEPPPKELDVHRKRLHELNHQLETL